MNGRARQPVPAVAVGIGAMVFALLRTLWPTAKGLADQGDGQRYVCQLDLVPVGSPTRYLDYALFAWTTDPGSSAAGCDGYPSSQVWIMALVRKVTEIVSGTAGAMDLRWLLAANAVLVGLLAAVLFTQVHGRIAVRMLATAVLVVVLTDPAFAGYAGSVYGEYPGVAGVAVLGVGAVLLAQTGRRQWLGLGLVGLGTAAVVTSKAQGLTVLLPVAVLLVCSRLRPAVGPGAEGGQVAVHPAGRRHARGRRLPGQLSGRIPVLLMLAALVVPAVWELRASPADAGHINPWEVISVGILPRTADPGAALAEMGLPTGLAKYTGQSVWVNGSILFSADWDAYKDEFTYQVAGGYLVRHPGVAVAIADQAADDFFLVRPDYLGSYGPDRGRAGEVEASPLATLGRLATGGGLFALVVLWGVLAVLAAALRQTKLNPFGPRHGLGQAALFLLALAAVEFGTAAFGEAIENTKHLVYAIEATALAAVFILAGLLSKEGRPDA